MSKYISNLKGTDLVFFYSILYQHEKETKHKGYNFNNIEKSIRDAIQIYNKTKTHGVNFGMPNSSNTIVMNCFQISVPLLTHLRHALAHACIERVGNEYLINQNCNPKCKICGRVNIPIFKKFIKALVATRNF